jgi:hypothetical protein
MRTLVGVVLLSLGCSRAAPAPALAELSGRSVTAPSQLGWVSSQQSSGDLPSAIELGGKASGRVLVYLEFPAQAERRRLLRAELLLGTLPGAQETLEVELSRAAPARGPLRSWSDQPRARYPRLSVQLTPGAAPLRVDVTELVRAQTKLDEPLRILLRAEPREDAPVLLQTGAAGGVAPRLEQYWSDSAQGPPP